MLKIKTTCWRYAKITKIEYHQNSINKAYILIKKLIYDLT
jgi:hypothetical protein